MYVRRLRVCATASEGARANLGKNKATWLNKGLNDTRARGQKALLY